MGKTYLLICLMLMVTTKAQYIDLANLGASISAAVNEQVAPLQNLGAQISQSVYEGLEPVRALEITAQMKNGQGGITIIKYQPEGKEFLVKNSVWYTCDALIDLNNGNCKGKLTPFQLTPMRNKSDNNWCYVNNFSIINDKICLGIYNLSVSVINGIVSCRSDYENSAILLNFDEYKKLCYKIRSSTEYKYIPNLIDISHVEIPNKNKYVKCENLDGNFCIFTEDNLLNFSHSSSVIITKSY